MRLHPDVAAVFATPRIYFACHRRHVRDDESGTHVSARQVSILDHLDSETPTILAISLTTWVSRRQRCRRRRSPRATWLCDARARPGRSSQGSAQADRVRHGLRRELVLEPTLVGDMLDQAADRRAALRGSAWSCRHRGAAGTQSLTNAAGGPRRDTRAGVHFLSRSSREMIVIGSHRRPLVMVIVIIALCHASTSRLHGAHSRIAGACGKPRSRIASSLGVRPNVSRFCQRLLPDHRGASTAERDDDHGHGGRRAVAPTGDAHRRRELAVRRPLEFDIAPDERTLAA